jgi:hypothetical protein
MGHGIAECWFGEGDTVHDADTVDYVQGFAEPRIRDGQYVHITAKDRVKQLWTELEAMKTQMQ